MKEKEIVLIGTLAIVLLLSIIIITTNRNNKEHNIRITRIEEIGD